MKVVVLYHPKSEHGGKVQDYARDFHIRYPDHKLELLSVDTKEGANMATLYDVTRYPSMLAIAPDGTMHKLWQDEYLPLMDEVAFYFHE